MASSTPAPASFNAAVASICPEIAITEGKIKTLTDQINSCDESNQKLAKDLKHLQTLNTIFRKVRKYSPYTGLASTMLFVSSTTLMSLPFLAIGGVGLLFSFIGCEYVPKLNNKVVDTFNSKQSALDIGIAEKQVMMSQRQGLESELAKMRKATDDIKEMNESLTPGTQKDIIDDDEFVSIRGVRLEKLKRFSQK